MLVAFFGQVELADEIASKIANHPNWERYLLVFLIVAMFIGMVVMIKSFRDSSLKRDQVFEESAKAHQFSMLEIQKTLVSQTEISRQQAQVQSAIPGALQAHTAAIEKLTAQVENVCKATPCEANENHRRR